MSLTPHYTPEFSDADLEKMDTALAMLEELFAAKVIPLQAGVQSIDAAKAGGKQDHAAAEESPAFIDMSQWLKDEAVRAQIGTRAERLENIAEKIIHTNAAILKHCSPSAGN